MTLPARLSGVRRPWTSSGAGAALANAGAFIPLGLKDISEMHPSTTGYITEWVLFSLVSLLPLTYGLDMSAGFF